MIEGSRLGGDTKGTLMSKVRQIVVAALMATTLSAGITVGTQGAAYAANGGSATCIDQSRVVGVWVNVSGGRSGWASHSGPGYYSQSWSYNTQGRPYSLTVGCGGTAKNWASSSSTPNYSRNWAHVNCYPGWKYGGASRTVHDKCF